MGPGAILASRTGRLFLLAATLVQVGCGSSAQASVQDAGEARPPNVVLIVVDDVGYGELAAYGSGPVPTPHMDSIGAAGVRFTAGYVCSPLCAPSRAGILTGRHPSRYGFLERTGPVGEQRFEDVGVSTDEVFLSEMMQQAGYATAAIGKWHLGVRKMYQPLERGFDEFFGYPGGTHDYFRWSDDDGGPILRGRTPVEGTEYLTTAFTREAVDFIERHREAPFFLYLAHNAAHGPPQVPARYTEPFEDVKDEHRRKHLGVLAALDEGIGRVLDALRAAELEEDTLVILLSDNGGTKQSDNGGFAGHKTTLFEGGIRVPFVVKWPRLLPAGQVYDRPVSSLDILPTVLAAAGVELPVDRAYDGVDLFPFLTGKAEGVPHPTLFWETGMIPHGAVRRGDLKLLFDGRGKKLFDLSRDAGETTDLAREMPAAVGELETAFRLWKEELEESESP